MEFDVSELINVAETDSTNNYLIRLCNTQIVKELTTVRADYQTAGRGQRGNGWESEPGRNLLFSYVLYPLFLEVSKQFLLSQIHALALQEVLSDYTQDDAIGIKWPNDIYWQDRKLCGTLIENEWEGNCVSRSVTGTGINVNQAVFVSDAPNPVSLYQITGKHYDCIELLGAVMRRTGYYYDLLRQGAEQQIMQSYCEVLYRRKGMHRYRDKTGEFYAFLHAVEANGRLLLEDSVGHLRGYMFKEVEFVL